MWISSHATEPAKPTRPNSTPKIETLLSEGPPREEMSRKIGNQGSPKKAKSRPFDYLISHNFFTKFPCSRVSKRGEIGTLVSRKGLRRRRGYPFFGTCLTSLVLVERGCLLLYHGEPTIIITNSGDSRMARSHPHTINFNVQRPRAH